MTIVAAAVAALAAWILVTGSIPRIALPTPTLPGPRVVAAAAGSAGTAFVLALGVLAVPLAAAAVGILAATIPLSVDAARRRRTRETVAAAWPDVLARLGSRIAAGEPIPEAFVEALDDAPEPLAAHAARVAEAVTYGDGFSAAVDRLRRELDDATADRVLVALAAANETGGSRVARSISLLAASVADELRLRSAHHAALTEQRLTAAVALVAPWALLALTIATNPQAADAYRTDAGGVVIAIGLAATGSGYLLARRAAALSRMPRVFR